VAQSYDPAKRAKEKPDARKGYEQGLADPEPLESEFERLIMEDDDTAAREILASGVSIHITYPDTPSGYVVEVHPDGREELVWVDREAAARILA
jgi:hypothetical protein